MSSGTRPLDWSAAPDRSAGLTFSGTRLSFQTVDLSRVPFEEAAVIDKDQEQLRQMSTAELVRHAVDEARLLVKAEVLYAKRELRDEIAQAKRSGIFAGAAMVLLLTGLSSLFVALGIALPGAPGWGVAIVGAVQIIAAGALGFLGFKKLPKKPMAATVARIKTDIEVTREQFA